MLIDWLEFTEFPQSGQPAVTDFFIDMLGADAKVSAGRYGYKSRISNHENTISVYIPKEGDERMGCHVSLSGQALANFDSAFGLLAFVARSPNRIKWTRLDLAVDLIEEVSVPVLRALALHSMNDGAIRKRKWSEIVNSEGGNTFYIGSRSSDLFGRLYDKGAQQGTHDIGIWTRVEFELKGDIGQNVADVAGTAFEKTAEKLAEFFTHIWLELLGQPALNTTSLSQWGVTPSDPRGRQVARDNDYWLCQIVPAALGKRFPNAEFDVKFAQKWAGSLVAAIGRDNAKSLAACISAAAKK